MKTEPREHQKKCEAAMWQKRNFAVVLGMGRGKTKVAIDDACALFLNRLADQVVVVAPPGVTDQWIDQLKVHSDVEWDALLYCSPSSRTAQYQREMDRWLKSDRPRFLAIHYEAFVTAPAQDFVRSYLSSKRTVMILDESTKIKNPKARRTKALLKMAPLAAYRRVLTGHPVTRGVENLWSQYAFLDPNILGKSYWLFRSRYCITQQVWGAPKGATKIVGYRDVDSLLRIIAPISYIDHGAAPVVPRILRRVAPSDEQMRIAQDLKAGLALVGNDVHQMKNALESLIRIQQVASGFLGESLIPNNRVEAFGDVLDECGPGALVWCRFHQDLTLCAAEAKKRGFSTAEYSGRTSPQQRHEYLEAFRQGKIDALLIQIQAGSHGLDIPQAKTTIFYSHTWDAEMRQQAEGRMRAGMIHEGLIVDIVVDNIIDHRIMETIKQRGDLRCLVEGLMKDLQEGKRITSTSINGKNPKPSFVEENSYHMQDFTWTGK